MWRTKQPKGYRHKNYVEKELHFSSEPFVFCRQHRSLKVIIFVIHLLFLFSFREFLSAAQGISCLDLNKFNFTSKLKMAVTGRFLETPAK